MPRPGRFAPSCLLPLRHRLACLLAAGLIAALASPAEAAEFFVLGVAQGQARLQNTTQSRFSGLGFGNTGTLAQVLPSRAGSQAVARADLAYTNNFFAFNTIPQPARLELTTTTRSERRLSPAAASAFTGSNSTTAQWLPVVVLPNFSLGERLGDPVQVTVNVSYAGTRQSLGPARNQVQMGYNNILLIDLDDVRGVSMNRAATFSSTIGGRFTIGSSLVTTSKYGAAMSGQTVITLTAN